jgi:hypothetical protein
MSIIGETLTDQELLQRIILDESNLRSVQVNNQ